MRNPFAICSLLLTLCLTMSASGQDKKLGVGASAPGLDIEQWVSGDEMTIESGRTYVVAFFTSEAQPSRKALSALNDLQKDYGDRGLTVLAISWEEPAVVSRFVESLPERPAMTIAADRREGTKRAWIDAAGIQRLPAAFLIDRKGKIAWQGSPTASDFTAILPRVMSGRYDPRLEAQAQPGIQGAANARKVRNWRMADKYYDDVVGLDASVFASVALDRFEMHLVDMGDKAGAYAYAKTLIEEKFASDAGALQMLADKIASDPRIDTASRDMDVALAASLASAGLLGGNDPEALAGLARIRFARGEMDEALELQKQAYFSASPKHKPEYKRQLEIYQQKAERAANMKPTP